MDRRYRLAERLVEEQGALAYLFQQLSDLYMEVELLGHAEESYRMALDAAKTSKPFM